MTATVRRIVFVQLYYIIVYIRILGELNNLRKNMQPCWFTILHWKRL